MCYCLGQAYWSRWSSARTRWLAASMKCHLELGNYRQNPRHWKCSEPYLRKRVGGAFGR